MNKFRMVFSVLSLALITTSISYANPEITRGKIYTPGDTKNFKDALANYENVVVDFYADWCGPCKKMHKIIESLAQELGDILFIKINVETQKDISSEYNVMSLPTIIMFKDGKAMSKKIVGTQEKSNLKRMIKETLGF